MEEPQLNWYAIKVFYNKVFEMETALDVQGHPTFLATDKKQLKGEEHVRARKRIATLKLDGIEDRRYLEEGPVIYQRIPMISSLLFVQATEDDIKVIDNDLREEKYHVKGYIYKKRNEKDGRYFCAVIPNKEMEAFRLVTRNGSEGLEFFSDKDIDCFRCGDKVRVTEGPFKGAEGYIKRIRRDRRLIVGIEGIVAIATTHIEPQFLEVIPQ